MEWVKIYETYGLWDAEVVAGRLRSESIPARTWAESAGRAIGLTIGKLGTAYVEIPAEFADRARAILAIDYSTDEDFNVLWEVVDDQDDVQ